MLTPCCMYWTPVQRHALDTIAHYERHIHTAKAARTHCAPQAAPITTGKQAHRVRQPLPRVPMIVKSQGHHYTVSAPTTTRCRRLQRRKSTLHHHTCPTQPHTRTARHAPTARSTAAK